MPETRRQKFLIKTWISRKFLLVFHIFKFILLLRKGVYSKEYIDNWEKFNYTSLTENEDFYSHLNMEDITDADYKHA